MTTAHITVSHITPLSKQDSTKYHLVFREESYNKISKHGKNFKNPSKNRGTFRPATDDTGVIFVRYKLVYLLALFLSVRK
jgi:hypothetical protein